MFYNQGKFAYHFKKICGQFRITLFIVSLFALSANYRAPLASSVLICQIQGENEVSSYAGEYVTTRGVVYGDLDETEQKGFFIQKEDCDSKPNTSDGIFIYTGKIINLVSTGDLVQVSGWVNEYYGMTEISVAPSNVQILSQENPLPEPQELDPPFENRPSISYFESLEGMSVRLSEGVVVGSTDLYDRSWLVRSDLGLQRVYWDDLAGTGEIICVDDEGLAEIAPEVKVGDRVSDLSGALDYRFEVFCLQPLISPQVLEVEPEPIAPGFSLIQDEYRRNVATFNLGNFFDTTNDPLTDDLVLSTTEYNRKLSKLAQAMQESLSNPAMIAIQEAENLDVLADLISRPEFGGLYGIIHQDGPDRRGLDLGLLYRTDMVMVENFRVFQGCTRLNDGLGPDGNLDVTHPKNNITCDSDGDNILDGNRLFSRPPLVVFASQCLPDCSLKKSSLILINNHWKSKTEDRNRIQYTLPRRVEQANFVSQLADQFRQENPSTPLIILGDFNDAPGSEPLNILSLSGFNDLVMSLPRDELYSYNYQGISQVLDHILTGATGSEIASDVGIIHINSDFPFSDSYDAFTTRRSSDHDPFIVQFSFYGYQVFLPLVIN